MTPSSSLSPATWAKIFVASINTHPDHWGQVMNELVARHGFPKKNDLWDELSKAKFDQIVTKKITAATTFPCNADFWLSMINALDITTDDLQKMPFLMNFWMLSGEDKVVANVVTRSSNQELEPWLEQSAHAHFWIRPTISKKFQSDTINTPLLASLVHKNYSLTVDALHQKNMILPWRDKNNQTLLHYATTSSMVKQLIALGLDSSHQDRHEKTAADFWQQTLLNPQAFDWIDAINQEKCAQGLMSQEQVSRSVLVHKIYAGLTNYTEQEQQAIRAALDDPEWFFDGQLCGVKRQWTLPEVWNMGLMAAAHCMLPVLKSSVFSHLSYAISNGGVFASDYMSKSFVSQIKEAEKKLDPRFSNPNHSNLTMAIRWMFDSSITPSSSQFEAMMQALSPLWKTTWLNQVGHDSGLVGDAWLKNAAKNMVTPFNKGGWASPTLAQDLAKMSLGEGLRTTSMANAWIHALAQSKTPLPSDPEELKHWAPVLRLGLIWMAQHKVSKEALTLPEDLLKKASAQLIQMISAGVPMEPVLLRWSKKYPPELGAAVQRWVIEKEIETKVDVTPEPARKRRM